jgi:hypothetical protein
MTVEATTELETTGPVRRLPNLLRPPYSGWKDKIMRAMY